MKRTRASFNSMCNLEFVFTIAQCNDCARYGGDQVSVWQDSKGVKTVPDQARAKRTM